MIIIIYVIWDHLGVIWETFGNHLGSIWETSGRVEAEEASGGQISYYLPHSRTECTSSIKFKFHESFLRVPLSLAAYLQQYLSAAASADPMYPARPLYQDRENPYS